MNLSSNFNRLSFNKLPLLKQSEQAEVKPEEELVVVQKQPTKIPRAEKITASALDAEALQNLTFVSTATTLDSNKLVGGVKHLTEAEAKEQGYTIIKTAEDLVKLSKGELKGTKFILMNDIDMSNVKNWKGIELKNTEFNGNGCTVKNLTGKQGLFSKAYDSTIKNINIDNANIESTGSNVGTLVGYGQALQLENCHVTNSKITGKDIVGGLVGKGVSLDFKKFTVKNCSVDAEIIRTNETNDAWNTEGAGGLFGQFANGVANASQKGGELNIENVNVNVKINSPHCDNSIGGLIGNYEGYAVNKVYISNSSINCKLNILGNEVSKFSEYGNDNGPYRTDSTYGSVVGCMSHEGYVDNSVAMFGSRFIINNLNINNPIEGIQYKYPDLIDMEQDEKDMKDAAYKQGLTESPCSGVYSKKVRSGNGYKTVYYIWNSNDKEFERCNDIKSINADGSYVNNRGKTINKPANEQIAARIGGYTPTVEEGTYFKGGKYYNYDEDSNEFFEVDKSLYEVHDEETTNTNGTKAEDTKTDDTKADGTKSDGSSTIKKPENRKFIEVDFDGTLTPYNPNSRLIKVKLPYDFPLYKRFNK